MAALTGWSESDLVIERGIADPGFELRSFLESAPILRPDLDTVHCLRAGAGDMQEKMLFTVLVFALSAGVDDADDENSVEGCVFCVAHKSPVV